MPDPRLTHTDPSISALLADRGIQFTRVDHRAVFTCDEADTAVPAEIGGVHTKNLFLRDKKGRRHWLVVTTCAKTIDLRALASLLGADNLSLGSPERLVTYLGLTPGSVTLLGLINDPERLVTLIVDSEVWAAESVRCHPLINTATLIIPRQGIRDFIALTGHHATILTLPEKTNGGPSGPPPA